VIASHEFRIFVGQTRTQHKASGLKVLEKSNGVRDLLEATRIAHNFSQSACQNVPKIKVERVKLVEITRDQKKVSRAGNFD
jgi:hypothetical protein